MNWTWATGKTSGVGSQITSEDITTGHTRKAGIGRTAVLVILAVGAIISSNTGTGHDEKLVTAVDIEATGTAILNRM
jgi:hypothetical protein